MNTVNQCNLELGILFINVRYSPFDPYEHFGGSLCWNIMILFSLRSRSLHFYLLLLPISYILYSDSVTFLMVCTQVVASHLTYSYRL
jgi:hypothetical protein